jgi:hypothetical protein
MTVAYQTPLFPERRRRRPPPPIERRTHIEQHELVALCGVLSLIV